MPWPKATGEGKGLVGFQVTGRWCQKSKQEPRQQLKVERVKEGCLLACYLPSDGTPTMALPHQPTIKKMTIDRLTGQVLLSS